MNRRELFCITGCTDDAGKPRLAAQDGVTVCEVCRGFVERDLTELPELYEQLLDPTQVPKGPKSRKPPGSDSPGPMDFGDERHPGPGDVRGEIRQVLAEATAWLAKEHGITAPRVALSRNLTQAHNRSIVFRTQAQVTSNVEAIRGMVAANRAARLYSNDLLTYDPVPSMAGHLRRHLTTILRDSEAAEYLMRQLHALVRLARSRATPNPPPPNRIGRCTVVLDGEVCGGSVRVKPNEDKAICGKCRVEQSLNWWLTQFQVSAFEEVEGRRVATYEEISTWLSRRYFRPITQQTIRKAVSAADSKLPKIEKAGKDSRHRTLVDVASAQAHYDALYTPIDAGTGPQQRVAVL